MGATQHNPTRTRPPEARFNAGPQRARFPQTDQSWRNDAACIGLEHLFFLDVGASSKPARAICASCPVIEPCLDYALSTNPIFGIWGGHTYKELQTLRRQRRAAS